MFNKRSQKGFTLVELIMVIVLFGIISVIAGKTLFQGYQLFLTGQNISEADWQAFYVLEKMMDDIHTIRSANDISSISSTQLTFTNTSNTSVQYQLSGSNLLRNSVTLASGIQSFSLSYLNKNGTTTATPSAVRYILISVTASQGGQTANLSTLVGARVGP